MCEVVGRISLIYKILVSTFVVFLAGVFIYAVIAGAKKEREGKANQIILNSKYRVWIKKYPNSPIRLDEYQILIQTEKLKEFENSLEQENNNSGKGGIK